MLQGQEKGQIEKVLMDIQCNLTNMKPVEPWNTNKDKLYKCPHCETAFARRQYLRLADTLNPRYTGPRYTVFRFIAGSISSHSNFNHVCFFNDIAHISLILKSCPWNNFESRSLVFFRTVIGREYSSESSGSV